jgi:hypothetical protein
MSTTFVSNAIGGNVKNVVIPANITQVSTSGTSTITIASTTIPGSKMPFTGNSVNWSGYAAFVITNSPTDFTYQVVINSVHRLTFTLTNALGYNQKAAGTWDIRFVRKDASNCFAFINVCLEREYKVTCYEFGQLLADDIIMRIDATVNDAANSITSLYNVTMQPQ